MLKQETIKKIATILKLKESDLSAAITATDETDLAVADLTTVTDEDLTRIKNEEYKKGKDTGVEMKVKEIKEKTGIDFNGKSIEGLIEAATKKALDDAKVSPDKKVVELEADKATLSKAVDELTKQVAEKEGEASRAKTDRELFKEVPETTLGATDLLDFARMKGYDFKLENGQTVPYKNGEPIKDNLAKVRASKDVLAEFAKEHGLTKPEAAGGPAGRGGKDQTAGDKPTKLSEIKKQFVEQNKNLLGDEFRMAVQQAAKDTPEFDMNA
jgi:hypothetical protein